MRARPTTSENYLALVILRLELLDSEGEVILRSGRLGRLLREPFDLPPATDNKEKGDAEDEDASHGMSPLELAHVLRVHLPILPTCRAGASRFITVLRERPHPPDIECRNPGARKDSRRNPQSEKWSKGNGLFAASSAKSDESQAHHRSRQ